MGQEITGRNGTGLVKYEAACRALAEARAVDEVTDIRAKAEAMRVYAAQAKNKQLEVDAAEIRIRAERRLGQLIAEQKAAEGLNKGGRPAEKTGSEKEPVSSPVLKSAPKTVPTLAEAGIDKKLSSRAQKLAAVPDEQFEAEVADWRGRIEDENARVTTRLEQAGEVAQRSTELADLRQQVMELGDLLAGFSTATEGEQAAAKEIARLQGKLRVVETQRDTAMEKCNQLIREVKSLRRRLGEKA